MTVANKSSLCTISDHLFAGMDSHGLHQFNNSKCNGNVLDLGFSKNVTMDVTIAQKASSSTHAPLYTVIDAEIDHNTLHRQHTTLSVPTGTH